MYTLSRTTEARRNASNSFFLDIPYNSFFLDIPYSSSRKTALSRRKQQTTEGSNRRKQQAIWQIETSNMANSNKQYGK